jgi:CP family cyanate transporter-like MFS transporter
MTTPGTRTDSGGTGRDAAVPQSGQAAAPGRTTRPGRAPAAGVRLAIILLVAALNLRMAVAAISPVLDTIQHDLGLSSAAAGLLDTVPIFCFGLFALLTPRLIARFGMEWLLVIVMVVITAGIALRLLPPVAALFAGTAVAGAGIAVGNVLLPGLIKQDFAAKAGLMTGLYSVMLFVGPALAAGLTVPIMHAADISWRPAVAVWGAVAVVAALLLSPHAAARSRARRRAHGPAPDLVRPDLVREGTGPAPAGAPPAGSPPARSMWRDSLAWMVAGFMGLQSLGYYSGVAWIPTLLQSHGMDASQAGWMLSYSSFPGLVAALVTPMLIRGRARVAGLLVVIATICCGAGVAGLAFAPLPFTYGWMTILGLGQGMCISLALGFIVARAPDVHHTARLSTMAQSSGYMVASAGPFVVGGLHGLTGEWRVPMLALLVVLVPLLLCGLGASRDRHVLAPKSQ